MEFVDSHCHLQFDDYKTRENQVLADAAKAGVHKIICVGTNLDDSGFATGFICFWEALDLSTSGRPL